MLKRITISKDKFTVQDIDTNEATMDYGNAINTEIHTLAGVLDRVEITLTLDQAKELAKALGLMEVEVTE